MNDADIEMAEMSAAAMTAAAGICRHCGDVLDPFAPSWQNDPPRILRLRDGSTRELSTDEFAEILGPLEPGMPYHASCWRDLQDERQMR